MTAGQLMTRALQVAYPETTVAEAMAKMTVGRFRHMPVMERDKLVGLISIGDVVKARIMEQEDEVDSLRPTSPAPPDPNAAWFDDSRAAGGD